MAFGKRQRQQRRYQRYGFIQWQAGRFQHLLQFGQTGLGIVLIGNIMAVANNSVAWLFWCVVIGLAFFGTTHYLENR